MGELAPRCVNVSGLFFAQMNVPPILLREPAFLELREKLGLGAMHALVAIGTILQSKREDKIKITSKRQLLMSCDLVGDVDPDLLWDCIVGHWLIPIGNDEYSMPLFTEHNKQLLTNWENGRITQRNLKEKKPKKEKGSEAKATECNATQLNREAPCGADSGGEGTALCGGIDANVSEDDEILLRNHGIISDVKATRRP